MFSFQKLIEINFNNHLINKTMKVFSVLIFYIFLSSTTFAQQEINTTFKNQMNTTFGNLDKNRIPHGILLDYGMEFTNVPAYDGTLTDSTYTDIMTMSKFTKHY